jgi:hypothetical protein
VSLDQPDATFLFEVVNKRYQTSKSIVVTSSKSFEQGGEIGDQQSICSRSRYFSERADLRVRQSAALTILVGALPAMPIGRAALIGWFRMKRLHA